MIKLKDIPSLTANKSAREIDFAKEFVLDTPWMVGDIAGRCDEFVYAICYMPFREKSKLHAFYEGREQKTAMYTSDWKYARHLTPEEEIKYLGVK